MTTFTAKQQSDAAIREASERVQAAFQRLHDLIHAQQRQIEREAKAVLSNG